MPADRRCGQRWGRCLLRDPAAPVEPPGQFFFSGVFSEEHSTEHIYNETPYPLVEVVTEGYNGTIFACGQSGSGKSFTMQGVVDPSSQKGIIPRAFEHIFESTQCAEKAKLWLGASYLEIYNEDIQDLLGADTKQKLEGFYLLRLLTWEQIQLPASNPRWIWKQRSS